MHGQVRPATTQEVLDHHLKRFVEAVNAVRDAGRLEVGRSDALRKARDDRAKAETALIKAYNNHHRER